LLFVLKHDPGTDACTGALGDVGVATPEIVDALVRAINKMKTTSD
jgi:hypothetical protein